MRFGLFTTLYDCGGGAETPADVLDNLREQVVLAEQLGYDAVWMGEHHFGPYGLGDLPNPILVGADLAVRTSRIRIGQMANIAPWWHPDPAGRGPRPPGQPHPGPGRRRIRPRHLALRGAAVPSARRPAEGRREPRALSRDRRDRAEGLDRGALRPPGPELHVSRARHAVRASALSGRPDVAGRRPGPEAPRHAEALPAAASAALDDRVDRPLGQLRRGARAPAVLLAAAAAPGPAAHGALRGRSGRASRGGRSPRRRARPCCGTSTWRRRWRPPAREAEAPILSAFIYNDPFRGREVFTNPGEELQPGTKLDWEFLEPRNLLVGPPEHVAERVQELAEVCGLETLLVEHAHPGIPQRLILRNLELFATKVMPAFRRGRRRCPRPPPRRGRRATRGR